ncbi:hypothetical protein J3F84DRAFT_370186, partial [Trichoderma pleuroticola]
MGEYSFSLFPWPFAFAVGANARISRAWCLLFIVICSGSRGGMCTVSVIVMYLVKVPTDRENESSFPGRGARRKLAIELFFFFFNSFFFTFFFFYSSS